MDSIARWISVLHRQFQIFLNRELKDYGIHSSEYIFLINLDKEEGVSQEKLSASLFIDKAATARAIARLEKSGLVRKARDLSDGRINLVTLTDKGLEMRGFIQSKLAHWRQTISEGLSEEEVDYMITRLKRMSQNALIETNKDK